MSHAKLQWSPFVAADEFVSEAEARHKSTFFEPKYGAERPQQKMPLTAAKAMICLAKLALAGLHHVRAQDALCCTHGIVSVARRICSFVVGSLMYVSMRSEYTSLCMFSTIIWKP